MFVLTIWKFWYVYLIEYLYDLWSLKIWVLVPGLSLPSCEYPSQLTSLNVSFLIYKIGILTISSEVSMRLWMLEVFVNCVVFSKYEKNIIPSKGNGDRTVISAVRGREHTYRVRPSILEFWALRETAQGVYSQCPEFKNLCVVYDIAGCFFTHTLKIEPNLESNLWLNKTPLLKDSLHFFSQIWTC